MRLSLQMPDEVYDAYAAQAATLASRGSARSASPEDMMVSQLQRFAKVAPMDRVIVVDSASREALENLLTGGNLTSGPDLLQRVKHLASLEIGNIRVEFTDRQFETLKNYASRNRITPEDAAVAVVRGMQDSFFDIAG